jgi:hypothetical protein
LADVKIKNKTWSGSFVFLFCVQLTSTYEAMSEDLPALYKNINLLSTTVSHRSSSGVIDRCPKPDMADARTYFYRSFMAVCGYLLL